jgi:hypothetical protein
MRVGRSIWRRALNDIRETARPLRRLAPVIKAGLRDPACEIGTILFSAMSGRCAGWCSASGAGMGERNKEGSDPKIMGLCGNAR